MKEVLILGNGVSRKNCEEVKSFVENWKKEIWVCNRAFYEYESLPSITKITGDPTAIDEYFRVKDKLSIDFYVYVRYTMIDRYKKQSKVCGFNFDKSLQVNSGTSLVIEAIEEGYDKIYLAGFDLGGPDIYVPDHEKKRKLDWIRIWRKINNIYGLEKINFIGYDHKPYIQSTQSEGMYYRNYIRGKDHLVKYACLNNKNKKVDRVKDRVLILGNGTSRKGLSEEIKNWEGEIWVCNHAYKEINTLNRIDRVGTVHEDVARQAVIFRNSHSLKYIVHCTKASASTSFVDFSLKKGWSSGSLLLAQALEEEYEVIVLAGFDFGGPDVYQKKPVVGSNFLNQFEKVINMYGYDKVFFLEKNNVLTPCLKKVSKLITIDHSFKKPNSLSYINPINNYVDLNIKNFLIFGNDYSLNNINFKELEDCFKAKDIITCGVNRIWKKFEPDIFFFIDGDIVKEIEANGFVKTKDTSKWFVSDYIYNNEYALTEEETNDCFLKNDITVIPQQSLIINKSSLLWLLVFLNESLYKDYTCKFYLYGVSLNVTSSNHHFWIQDETVNQDLSLSEMKNRFAAQYNGFSMLKKSGYNIFSLVKESRLNTLFPFIDLPLKDFLKDIANK